MIFRLFILSSSKKYAFGPQKYTYVYILTHINAQK